LMRILVQVHQYVYGKTMLRMTLGAGSDAFGRPIRRPNTYWHHTDNTLPKCQRTATVVN
jgi:hypothetical protein